MSSAKCWPFCLSLSVLNILTVMLKRHLLNFKVRWRKIWHVLLWLCSVLFTCIQCCAVNRGQWVQIICWWSSMIYEMICCQFPTTLLLSTFMPEKKMANFFITSFSNACCWHITQNSNFNEICPQISNSHQVCIGLAPTPTLTPTKK